MDHVDPWSELWQKRIVSEGNISDTDFGVLVGKTLTRIDRKDNKELVFVTTEGTEYHMRHEQDCCEAVGIEDVCGELDDLIGSPITLAEETSNSTDPPATEYEPESYTWTYYKLATAKGYVTIRWYGDSNGYYSERVSFGEVFSDTPETHDEVVAAKEASDPFNIDPPPGYGDPRNGDRIPWRVVPDDSMVRLDYPDGLQICFVKRWGIGTVVYRSDRSVWFGIERDDPGVVAWSVAAPQPDRITDPDWTVTVLALGLRGDESAAELRQFARVVRPGASCDPAGRPTCPDGRQSCPSCDDLQFSVLNQPSCANPVPTGYWSEGDGS